jgi:hypothetical protein
LSPQAAGNITPWDSTRAAMDALMNETDRFKVDKTLVAMFLKMSPEERLKANDNAVRAILELRNAFRQKQKNRS